MYEGLESVNQNVNFAACGWRPLGYYGSAGAMDSGVWGEGFSTLGAHVLVCGCVPWVISIIKTA